MSNRPARFTVADLRRALRAAEQAGPEWAVEIDGDGTIRIVRRADAKSSRLSIIGNLCFDRGYASPTTASFAS